MKLKLLWYCTKNKPYLFDCYQGTLERCAYVTSYSKSFKNKDYVLNGKIVAESDFEVEEIKLLGDELSIYYGVEERACLTRGQIEDYFGYENDYEGYAIHIKNLNVFDKPKELNEFYSHDDSYDNMFGCFFEDQPKYIPLKKAPRSMKYVYNKDGSQRYILISAHPEGLCRILNKIKDIDVRKRVLKEMLWHDCKA